MDDLSMKSKDLETTGFQKPNLTLVSTGTEHGKHGVVTLSTGAIQAMQNKLVSQSPKQTNQELLTALASRFGCLPKNPSVIKQGEPEITFEFSNSADLAAAAKAIEAVLVPAPDVYLLGAIAEVESLCARRAEDAQAAEIGIRAQMARFREFPADAVLAALKEWPVADFSRARNPILRRANQFCPSVADLINGVRDDDGYFIFKGIKARCAKRYALKHAFYYWKGKLNK